MWSDLPAARPFPAGGSGPRKASHLVCDDEPDGVRGGRSMRRGVLLGWIAYGIWGLFPLYWPLLEPASPLEILAHRIVWSFCVMAVLLLVMHRWSALRALPLRTWLQVIAA